MEEINEALEFGKLFKEIGHLLRHNMTKGFEDIGITMPQGMVIGSLSKFGKMKVNELSKNLGLSNSTVSGIIDRLEKQGMVERTRSEDDKRVVYVSLTHKFEAIHQGFHKRTEELMMKIMKRGSEEEINKIIEGLRTLKELLKRE